MDPSSGPSRPATPPPSTADDPAAIAASTAHLARFEFSEHGTKILMVEWHPGHSVSTGGGGGGGESGSGVDTEAEQEAGSTATSRAGAAAPNLHEVTPASAPASASAPSASAPSASAPSASATTGRDTDADTADAAAWQVSWPGKSTFLPAPDTDHNDARRRVYFLLPPNVPVPATVSITPPGRPSIIVNPLPAIFPEGFDAEAGPQGVLHTIWAKKRISELEREMDAEMRANAESVGLEMVLSEKQWIVDNFLHPLPEPRPAADSPQSQASPRSPTAGRLIDKLKGLRLATSPADLARSPTANTFTGVDSRSQTLSPNGDEIALPSFPRSSHDNATHASLDAALKGDTQPNLADTQDTEADLFALPISPRTPYMKKSPFSVLRAG